MLSVSVPKLDTDITRYTMPLIWLTYNYVEDVLHFSVCDSQILLLFYFQYPNLNGKKIVGRAVHHSMIWVNTITL